MHLWYKLISELLLFFGENVDCHQYDLCGIGRTGTNHLINGNFTYQGLDSSNSNQSWWVSTCNNVSLEWAGKWNSAYSFYLLKVPGSQFVIYGYCSEHDVLPQDCQNWYIYNATHFANDHAFSIRNCSYYTVSSMQYCKNNHFYLFFLRFEIDSTT